MVIFRQTIAFGREYLFITEIESGNRCHQHSHQCKSDTNGDEGHNLLALFTDGNSPSHAEGTEAISKVIDDRGSTSDIEESEKWILELNRQMIRCIVEVYK